MKLIIINGEYLMVKTAIILWTTEGVEYYIAEGNHSRLAGVCINGSGSEQLEDELMGILNEKLSINEVRDALLLPKTVLIECGYNF